MNSNPKPYELMRENAALKSKISELEALLKFYEDQFWLAKHRQFGASSEKSEYDQPDLFNEVEATADANIPEPALAEIKKHYRKRKRLVHDHLPDHLPVEVVEYDLAADEQVCPECGGAMHVMGWEKGGNWSLSPHKLK